jgi:hypothetical protein
VICCVGYQAVAFIGVLTFGKRIDHDNFNGSEADSYLYVFPPSHFVVTFLCLILVFTITLLFAVINFPMVQSVSKLIGMLPWDCTQRMLHAKHFRLGVTLTGMGLIVGINLAFEDMTVIFALCGGYGVSFVVRVCCCLFVCCCCCFCLHACRRFCAVCCFAHESIRCSPLLYDQTYFLPSLIALRAEYYKERRLERALAAFSLLAMTGIVIGFTLTLFD